jgi:hypothetical protein
MRRPRSFKDCRATRKKNSILFCHGRHLNRLAYKVEIPINAPCLLVVFLLTWNEMLRFDATVRVCLLVLMLHSEFFSLYWTCRIYLGGSGYKTLLQWSVVYFKFQGETLTKYNVHPLRICLQQKSTEFESLSVGFPSMNASKKVKLSSLRQRRLRVFENRMLRRIHRPKQKGIHDKTA